jgi:hypothetical protein
VLNTAADDFRELLITLAGEGFFDHYKAFVVYIDDEGRPEKVLYRLKQQPVSLPCDGPVWAHPHHYASHTIDGRQASEVIHFNNRYSESNRVLERR